MLYKWRRKLKTWNFDRQISGVLETPPLRLRDAPWTVVSMIMQRDVPMYVLTMKAFYTRLGGGRVVGIIVRNMPTALREMLLRHIDGIELIMLEDLDTGACQSGGTWERLVYILDHSSHRYTIQMDADILAVGPDIGEIVDCARNNVPFVMADGDRFRSMREAAQIAQADPDDRYVGIAIEQCFDRYPDCDQLRYIRGSSGLAGFARGGFTRARLEEFHANMQHLLPGRWHEWGSEQCGSNFAIANSPDPVALPYPAYGSFGPFMDRDLCKCYHFIGAHRFLDGYFAKRGREIIQQLDPAPRKVA